MDKNDKLRLQVNFRYLVGQIRVSDVMDFLYEKRILNDDDMEELDIPTTTKRNNVRKLLSILPKRGPRAYDVFCQALDEHYPHVVEKLQETDIGVIPQDSPDEIDSFLKEEGKLVEFQRQIWQQTELLEKYKRDLDELNRKVESKEELAKSYSRLEHEIQVKGYSDEFVVQSLKEYMVHAQRDYARSGKLPIPRDELLPPSPRTRHQSGGKDEICRVAMELSYDIVDYMTCDPANIPPLPNKYARTMRRTIKVLMETKASSFHTFLDALDLNENNGFTMLQNVADEMLRVGQTNWGRVIALYGFGGYIAKHATASRMDSISKYIAEFLGKYVAKNICGWIQEKGGWDDFEKFFAEGNDGLASWSGLFLTAIGLGALVSLASVRGSM